MTPAVAHSTTAAPYSSFSLNKSLRDGDLHKLLALLLAALDFERYSAGLLAALLLSSVPCLDDLCENKHK